MSREASNSAVQVSLLFAQGVDAGAQLALGWIEKELKRFHQSSVCPQQLLGAIRAQTRLVERSSFTRSVLCAQKRGQRSCDI